MIREVKFGLNLRKKMFIVFSAFTLAMSIVFCGIYTYVAVKNYEETENRNLSTAADNYAQQFQFIVDQMEQVIQQTLSNQEVLENIKVLSYAEDGKRDREALYTSARNKIRTFFSSDYFRKNFNRIVHFMQNGSVISGTSYEYATSDSQTNINDILWLNRLEGKRGQYIIIEEHIDDWGIEDKEVISVVKRIIGERLGYLEVQKSIDILDEMFFQSNENWNLFICQDSNMLYSTGKNLSQENINEIKSIIEKQGKTNIEEYSQEQYSPLIAVSNTFGEGIYAVIVDDTKIWKNAVLSILPIAIFLACSFGIVSFLGIYILSKHITEPIQQLKEQMEQTDIDNLQLKSPVTIKSKEFTQLFDSYRQVLVKLKQSIQKERLFSELQKQAQFDLLQAQVNPHFLFNILNVISGRAVEAKDEVICDICADLAQMLRYSTDVSRKQAKLQEEIHYLKLYLDLLKFRYEDQLEYEIKVSKDMDELEIPKMVLQQIVENSISHGYRNVDRIKHIVIEGECQDGYWAIKIRDNGIGIDEEKKFEIYQKCYMIKQALSKERSHVEMSIGGMGLVNSYARMYQIYGESFFMELLSPKEGAEVVIGQKEV